MRWQASLSLDAKHILMLVLSAMFAIAGGVTSSAIVTGNSNVIIIGAVASGLFLIFQLLTTFALKSETNPEIIVTCAVS